ncbi:TonB-dependent receptor [Pseudoflavitalea sp. X16]|uniref:SusC/RagA family TonB-linked outer membrane protein n=1 Tax=Paraflavitalea devenefica TaxID=2716334 RepID=UPI00141EC892|nr:TonB-dependent receptor [Paraflavitalea devenefica]NII25389.1 TonB-dependent receptor [Paraflavitalea devenefica]
MTVLVTHHVNKASIQSRLRMGKLMAIALSVLAALILALPVYAQNDIRIKGRVTGSDGQPVPRASVTVKGGTTGTNSDDGGNFELTAPSNATLVFSSVGFLARDVAVNGQTTINVSLTAATDLDQVVVVGYGTQRKRDVTGSVVSVSEKALREVPVANLQGALQGRAAGLEIQRTGTKPGAGAVIRIRGERSITGSNDPLIVLDGIPYDANLNDINPDDIASVDILKDASATAIYGSRGSNGVILITTKRGRTGEARLNYNGYYGINSVRTRYNVFNAQEYQALRNISTYTGGYMPEEKVAMAAGTSTDWQDVMYQDGYLTNHNLTVGGGANGSSWSLGGGYYKETTVLPGQDFTRYSLRGTIDAKVGKRIKIGLNTMNNINVTNGSQFNDPMFPILTLSPLMPVYDSTGKPILSPTGNTDDRVGQYNPVFLKHNNNNWIDRVNRMRSFNSLYGELQLMEGLKYRLNVGLDYRRQESQQFRSSDNALNPSYFRAKLGNTASVNNAESWGYTLENIVTYDKTIAGKHKINVTGLFSYQEDHTHNTFVSKDSIDENFIQFYNLGQANASNNVKPVVTGAESSFALVSYMARVNYAYDDRYMLTLTGRIDGSSVLAPGNKYHEYPAVSAGWNISNESFMRNIKHLSNLKLRVGFGQTSNQSVRPYSSLGQVSSYNGIGNVGSIGSIIRYNYGPTVVSGYAVTALPNKSLDWEYTKTVNVGLDFGVLNNRITGTIDWYHASTFKILYGIVLPPTSGIVGSYIDNIGEMENKGLEISISSANISSNNGFTWSTDFNIFFNRNKLVRLTDNFTQNIASQLFLGQPLTAIYDYKKLGIWQISEAAEAAKYGNLPGDIKLADISGPNGKPDGVIDPNYDRTVIGSSQAKWQGGMTNRFTYKGFDLSFVLYARYGGLLVSQMHQPFSAYVALLNGNRNTIKVDYWTPTNPTNDFPSPTSMTRTRPVGADLNTLAYYDASFVKLRSVNLGYTFPGGIIKKIGAQSARVYITAQNPWVIYSPYMRAGGVDPEATGTGPQGVQNPGNLSPRALTISVSTPPTKAFLVGVNVSF